MKDIKVIFMGTPDFAVPILDMLIKNTNVVMVVSQPDKCVGRHHELTPTPVKKLATENGIEVFQPTNIREDNEKILSMGADLIVTCAYGQIIPSVILDNPRLGCINVHASLLPKLRGGAPIHHAIIDGYDKTGVTIMYMDKKMDTGDIISMREINIEKDDNVGTLHDKLSEVGTQLLLDTLPSIVNGTNSRTPQNHEEATYAWNIKREEEHINFNRGSKEVYNQIRGLNPFPGCYARILETDVKIIDAYISDEDSKLSSSTVCNITKDSFGICTKDKVIVVTRVKPMGKKEMSVRDYINGVNNDTLLNSIVE